MSEPKYHVMYQEDFNSHPVILDFDDHREAHCSMLTLAYIRNCVSVILFDAGYQQQLTKITQDATSHYMDAVCDDLELL